MPVDWNSRAVIASVCGACALLLSVDQPASVQSTPPTLWGLDAIDQRGGTDGAYHYAATGVGVNVYMIDSGVLRTHNDFKDAHGHSRVTYVGDFCNATATGGMPRTTLAETYPDGYDGHGTHNASFAAGTASGVAKDAKIVSLRAQSRVVNHRSVDGPDCGDNDSRTTNAPAMIWAVKWVTAHGRRPAVVNISFGSSGSADLLSAIHTSIAAGFFYALSGNSGTDVATEWGSLLPSEALVVAGTAADGRALFTGYGTALGLYAPAKGLLGAGRASNRDYTIPEVAEGNPAGDSFAVPFVSGVAAAYLQGNRTATPSEVRRAILDGATQGKLTNIGSSPNRFLYSLILPHDGA